MAKADTSVKWFHSNMPDAPVLSGTAGALIGLLDACLINGFSTRTPDSVTVSGGVATVSIGAGNPYEKHAVIKITGASEPALNSEWRIDSVTASAFTVLCPGVADGTATGASIIRAPANWGKPFSGTNKAVYQSLDVAGTQLYLRVDDSAAQYVPVRGYENMTDIDTGTGPFPTTVQHALSAFTWRKSNAASSAACPWVLVADGAFLYFLPASNAAQAGSPHMFGDIDAVLPSDAYHCMIVAHAASTFTHNGISHAGTSNSSLATAPRYLARNAAQQAGPLLCKFFGLSSGNYFGGYDAPVAPGLAGESYVGSPVFIQDGASFSSPIRGRVPGLWSQLMRSQFGHLQMVGPGPDGRTWIAVNAIVGTSAVSTDDRILIDITGPWR